MHPPRRGRRIEDKRSNSRRKGRQGPRRYTRPTAGCTHRPLTFRRRSV